MGHPVEYWVPLSYAALLLVCAILCAFYSIKAVIVHYSIRHSPILLTLYLLVNVELPLTVVQHICVLYHPHHFAVYVMEVSDTAITNVIILIMLTRFVNMLKFLGVGEATQKVLLWACWCLLGLFLLGMAAVWIATYDYEWYHNSWYSEVLPADAYLIASCLISVVVLFGIFGYLVVIWQKVLRDSFLCSQKLLTAFALSEIVQYLLEVQWYFESGESGYDWVVSILISVFADIIPSFVICCFLELAQRRRDSRRRSHSGLLLSKPKPGNREAGDA